MKDQDRTSRILDNPTARAMTEALAFAKLAKSVTGFVKRLGVNNEELDKIHEQADEAVKHSDILTLPDRFNDAFASLGWIAGNSMSVDVMQTALEFYKAGKLKEAENEILSWFDENTINLFAIHRAKKFNKVSDRWFQLREALALTLEERYWSAVPLILIACDGFASDVLGTSPFEKDADLTAFDSIVGHPNSLPFLIKQLTKGVRRSSNDELSLPLRHGILHGQSLGYANRIVCMKAWALMMALVDWAHDKDSEGERIQQSHTRNNNNVLDSLNELRKLQEDKHIMNNFKVRETNGPFDGELNENTPEFSILQFLTFWKSKNYGNMGQYSTNDLRYSSKKLAGDLRQMSELVELQDFEIQSVRQTTVVRAEALVVLKGHSGNRAVSGVFEIVALRYTAEGDMAMPADSGNWLVQQRCIYEFLHGRTVGTARGD